MSHHCNVAIVGWSFAWLSALLMLRKRLGKKISIKLFDERDQFTHIPWLPEALYNTKHLSALQFKKSRYYPHEFVHQKVCTVKPNCLITDDNKERTFDYCIIATWSRTNFFENKQFEKYAYKVSYAEDISILNSVLPDAKDVTVVWWWYTGIEIATIIAQRKPKAQHVRVIHSRERLFSRLSENISNIAKKWLEKNNIELIVWHRVSEIQKDSIVLDNWIVFPSDVTIVARWIKANDEVHRDWLTFEKEYAANETDTIFTCGDVAVHWLYATWHNAMTEWRRVGQLVADKIQWVEKVYPPVSNRDKLAINLWLYDGILTNGKKWIYLPKLMGLFKRGIQQRVLFEFKMKILLPF